MLEDFKREEGLRLFHRGLTLERANRVTEAVEAYRQAIASYPYLREAHDLLGFYYQRNGLLAKAADEFHIVTTLEEDFLAYFNLGYVLVELERYEEALDAFQRCLKFAPEDTATHYELGFIHFSRGEFGTALEHLQRPLRNYPEDWEVHNLLGKCYLELRRYDEALAAFGRALMLAHVPQAQASILDSITTVERYREFRNLHSTKDQMYAQEGVVYLGSAQDDGLSVTEMQDYHFTYPDIATTLQRLLALHQGCRWHFTAIVAVDKLAQPVASALSELLHLPLRQLTELQADDTALLVMAVAREAELLLLTIERAACTTVAFCVGLNWLRHSKVLPELIGIVARGACSVPWESELRRLRADGAPAAQIDACLHNATHQILQAVRETPLDSNLPRQVRYYSRTHRRLSFSTVPESSAL